MKHKVLFIGLVWPEPQATAAGVRILQIVDFFQNFNCEVIFCSSANHSDLSFDLHRKGVQEVQIELNNTTFDQFLTEIKPDIVVFDRFLTEEQFGWRVEDKCPDALKILDTEDLHFLRKGRLSNKKSNFSMDDITKREIASIYRCDLSLIISEFEINLLQKDFQIPPNLLFYLPFLEDTLSLKQISQYPDFNSRTNFISIGNFKHEPNWKAVLKLKNDIWPLIRKQLKSAELHIYGAYATQKVFDLHNPIDGFIIKGWTDNVKSVYSTSKVCLAPLDYGAGIKGKLLNSMKYGTPNITTSIGAEGMVKDQFWNGHIEDKNEAFARKAIELYQDKDSWENFQKIGVRLFNNRFGKEQFYENFWALINNTILHIEEHRSNNFIGVMLRHHHHRSTKFLSKYIELKSRN